MFRALKSVAWEWLLRLIVVAVLVGIFSGWIVARGPM